MVRYPSDVARGSLSRMDFSTWPKGECTVRWISRKPGQEDRRYKHDVHRDVVFERDEAEEAAARHALNAVFAAGEIRLQAEEIQHLRQAPA